MHVCMYAHVVVWCRVKQYRAEILLSCVFLGTPFAGESNRQSAVQAG